MAIEWHLPWGFAGRTISRVRRAEVAGHGLRFDFACCASYAQREWSLITGEKNMAGKFARSWALMKASAAVLRSDKSLLVFPLLSGLCTLLVAASFLIPVGVMVIGGEHAGADLHERMSVGSYLLMFAFYLVQYFVIIFFQTALTGVALMHLRGEQIGRAHV